MFSTPIYLDYNSTTPVDPEVLETMLPYFSEKFGNASSRTHSYGWIAEDAVKKARIQVAEFLGCIDQEIIFTSGATESVNLAIKGVFETYKTKGNHIITVKTEHKAVLDVCSALEKKGAEITYLDVDSEGLINLEVLESSITDKTILVSVMCANNETGVIHPVKKISEIVHSRNSIFMSDATQAVGKIPVNVEEDGIDLLCLSAHKIYGPKGVGALYIRRKKPRVILSPQMEGGGHERGLRSGTLNVPGIVGLGKASELAGKNLTSMICIKELRDHLENQLIKISGSKINGHRNQRLPNTLNISFKGLKADSLISEVKGLAFSSGSACTSALPEPSHVLKAMGIFEQDAFSSIRISLGRRNNFKEVEYALESIKKVIGNLRSDEW